MSNESLPEYLERCMSGNAINLDNPWFIDTAVPEKSSLRYRDASSMSIRMAVALTRIGFRRGDVFLHLVRDTPYLPLVYLAVWKCGGAVRGRGNAVDAREVERLTEGIRVTVVLVDEWSAAAAIGASSTLNVISTTRSTKFPSLDQLLEEEIPPAWPFPKKQSSPMDDAVIFDSERTHRGAIHTQRTLVTWLKHASGKRPKLGTILTTERHYKMNFLLILLDATQRGETFVHLVNARPHPSLIDEYEVAQLALPAADFDDVVDEADGVFARGEKLRLLRSTDFNLSAATIYGLFRIFPRADVVMNYSIVEALFVAEILVSNDGGPATFDRLKKMSVENNVGQLWPGVKAEIREIGRFKGVGALLILTRFAMSAYVKDEITRKNEADSVSRDVGGWLYVNDIFLLEQGTLFHLGRRSDCFSGTDELICPGLLEMEIRKRTEVDDVVVVGIRDYKHANRFHPAAVVVPSIFAYARKHSISYWESIVHGAAQSYSLTRGFRLIKSTPLTGKRKRVNRELVRKFVESLTSNGGEILESNVDPEDVDWTKISTIQLESSSVGRTIRDRVRVHETSNVTRVPRGRRENLESLPNRIESENSIARFPGVHGGAADEAGPSWNRQESGATAGSISLQRSTRVPDSLNTRRRFAEIHESTKQSKSVSMVLPPDRRTGPGQKPTMGEVSRFVQTEEVDHGNAERTVKTRAIEVQLWRGTADEENAIPGAQVSVESQTTRINPFRDFVPNHATTSSASGQWKSSGRAQITAPPSSWNSQESKESESFGGAARAERRTEERRQQPRSDRSIQGPNDSANRNGRRVEILEKGISWMTDNYKKLVSLLPKVLVDEALAKLSSGGSDSRPTARRRVRGRRMGTKQKLDPEELTRRLNSVKKKGQSTFDGSPKVIGFASSPSDAYETARSSIDEHISAHRTSTITLRSSESDPLVFGWRRSVSPDQSMIREKCTDWVKNLRRGSVSTDGRRCTNSIYVSPGDSSSPIANQDAEEGRRETIKEPRRATKSVVNFVRMMLYGLNDCSSDSETANSSMEAEFGSNVESYLRLGERCTECENVGIARSAINEECMKNLADAECQAEIVERNPIERRDCGQNPTPSHSKSLLLPKNLIICPKFKHRNATEEKPRSSRCIKSRHEDRSCQGTKSHKRDAGRSEIVENRVLSHPRNLQATRDSTSDDSELEFYDGTDVW